MRPLSWVCYGLVSGIISSWGNDMSVYGGYQKYTPWLVVRGQTGFGVCSMPAQGFVACAQPPVLHLPLFVPRNRLHIVDSFHSKPARGRLRG